jgi:catechol 2,3-dioxygenase-like lactoylglutathione lyase family enzyme
MPDDADQLRFLRPEAIVLGPEALVPETLVPEEKEDAPRASVRYVVDDVAKAVAFYRRRLGFEEHPSGDPTLADIRRESLRLLLTATGEKHAKPGGWNRIQLVVPDLKAQLARLRRARVHVRGGVVEDARGSYVVIDDPSGNPIELFEPKPVL